MFSAQEHKKYKRSSYDGLGGFEHCGRSTKTDLAATFVFVENYADFVLGFFYFDPN